MRFEILLYEVYEVLKIFILKLYSNARGINISYYDDVWVTILIQFEVLSQTLTFYLQVANMVNVVLHSLTLLAIFNLGYFFLIA